MVYHVGCTKATTVVQTTSLFLSHVTVFILTQTYVVSKSHDGPPVDQLLVYNENIFVVGSIVVILVSDITDVVTVVGICAIVVVVVCAILLVVTCLSFVYCLVFAIVLSAIVFIVSVCTLVDVLVF